MLKKISNKNIQDCVACALKPAFIFGLGGNYFGLPFCKHDSDIKKPHFKEVSSVKGTFLFFIFILFLDIYYRFKDLQIKMDTGNVLEQVMNITITFNAILYMISLFFSQKVFYDYINYLIGLIENRKKFGIATILDWKTVAICRIIAYLFAVFFIYFVVFLSWNISSNLSIKTLVQLLASLLAIYKFFHTIVYCFISIQIYLNAFETFYNMIRHSLEEVIAKEEIKTLKYGGTVSFIDRLRFSRQFYLCICRLYNKRVLRGNVLYFAEEIAEMVIFCVFCFQKFTMYEKNEDFLTPMELFGVMVFFFYCNIMPYLLENSVSCV